MLMIVFWMMLVNILFHKEEMACFLYLVRWWSEKEGTRTILPMTDKYSCYSFPRPVILTHWSIHMHHRLASENAKMRKFDFCWRSLHMEIYIVRWREIIEEVEASFTGELDSSDQRTDLHLSGVSWSDCFWSIKVLCMKRQEHPHVFSESRYLRSSWLGLLCKGAYFFHFPIMYSLECLVLSQVLYLSCPEESLGSPFHYRNLKWFFAS